MKLRRGLPPCPPFCDFCPLCCKGGAIDLGGLRGGAVDPLQRFWVGRGNGLRVLDLSRAGDTCADRRFCQITCLVCGGPVVHGEDGRDFELFRDVVNGDAGGDGRRMHSILQRRKATMVENWDTPVHKACAFTSSRCDCVLARESAFCPTHETEQYARLFARRKAKKPGAEKKPQQRKQTFAQRLARSTRKPHPTLQRPIHPPNSQQPALLRENAQQPVRPPNAQQPVRPPNAQQPVRPQNPQNLRQKNSKLTEPGAGPIRPGPPMPPLRIKPRPKKVIPAPAGVPLINTLFARAKVAPVPANTATVAPFTANAAKPVTANTAALPPGACVKNEVWRKPPEPSSLWTEAYDPSKHGFWMVRGQLTYIFADGRRQLAGAVNGVSADGRLIPEKPL